MKRIFVASPLAADTPEGVELNKAGTVQRLPWSKVTGFTLHRGFVQLHRVGQWFPSALFTIPTPDDETAARVTTALDEFGIGAP